ncbi:hypothetical protein [Nostoc sp.]|uniref:hypothetical protein n=1 Tax=Nostoc sp. TaxID=1180 RepID=UPI002FF833BB
MPSISLDGLSTLKRDENSYLWLALRLAIKRTRGEYIFQDLGSDAICEDRPNSA